MCYICIVLQYSFKGNNKPMRTNQYTVLDMYYISDGAVAGCFYTKG